MTVAAVVIQRKEREIVNRFRGAGATSATRARDPEELGVDHHLAFRRLTDRAVLRDAGDGKYYLDELSWDAMRRLRRRIALVMILIAVAVFGVLFMSGALATRN